MKLSVVILHYNAEAFLHLNLLSVQRAVKDIASEIIVADNASEGFDLHAWERKYPGVKFIRFDQNYGFAKGNNLAVREAKGEYVALLNPDTVVSENIFKNLLSGAESLENPGILGVRLIDGRGMFLAESKRRLPNLLNAFARIFRLHNLMPLPYALSYYNSRLEEHENGPNEVFVGAFMFFERKKYMETGGFDERYFMYGEDIDLSKSFLEKGYEGYYFGTYPVVHFKGESTPKSPVFRQHFIRASERYYKKYHPLAAHFINPLIRAGLKLKFLFEKTAQARQIYPRGDAAVYYLGTDDAIRGKLERHFQREIRPATVIEEAEPYSVIVIDPRNVVFEELFQRMIEYRHRFYFFRFLVPDEDLLIGSDHPQSKGEIIRLQ
jgi:GT2 family glycosyltransferase